MTKKEKDHQMLNLKVRPELREEFKIAADLEGLDMSNMLRQFMIRSVRDAKAQTPEAFTDSIQTAITSRIALLKGIIGHEATESFLKSLLIKLSNEPNEMVKGKTG